MTGRVVAPATSWTPILISVAITGIAVAVLLTAVILRNLS